MDRLQRALFDNTLHLAKVTVSNCNSVEALLQGPTMMHPRHEVSGKLVSSQDVINYLVVLSASLVVSEKMSMTS